MSKWVDIGEGYAYSLYVNHNGDIPVGALVKHPLHDDDEHCRWRGECVGSILFRVPEAEKAAIKGDGTRYAQWDVLSLEPLHVTPSLKCHCGDHGFIHNGKWSLTPQELVA